MQRLWFIPTHGEGRYLGTAIGGRVVNFNYWRQIAQGLVDGLFSLISCFLNISSWYLTIPTIVYSHAKSEFTSTHTS